MRGNLSQQFLQEAWALPCWHSLPYRSVEVSLPDGSCFHLSAQDLAATAASRLSKVGAEPMTHLVEQILPLMQDCPEFLIEVASALSWPEACSMAREPFWRSPSMLLAHTFKKQARMSLRPRKVH